MKNVQILLIALVSLFAVSCKTDEFKISEISLKGDWTVPLITPMLKGNMEFKDLVYDWDDNLVATPGEKMTVLRYPDGTVKSIPTRIIFDPSAVIDSFYFLIKGEYDFVEMGFKYIVSNGSPFPLNFQMEFFDRATPSVLGPPILPPPFAKGDFSGAVPNPVASEHFVPLSSAQIRNFIDSDRIRITTWYDKNSYIDSHDTLKSNYPIDISVIVVGKIKADY